MLATMDTVSSLDPSSQTKTSRTGNDWRNALSIALPTVWARFHVGITTDTLGCTI
jgi:hypothetical protein